MIKYKCLVIDPPWNQAKTGQRIVRPNQSRKLNYATMTKAELLKLPVNQWADDNCFLWLWATNSKDKKNQRTNYKNGIRLS